MFDKEAFKQYLLDNADAAKANKIALAELINAITDFSQTPDKYLGVASNTSSYYIKKVFYKALENKPKSVSVQKYLLNTYGYQKCYKCCMILRLDEYNKKEDRWNFLDNECRSCSNERYRNYRKNNIDKELARSNKYKQENKETVSINRIARYRKNSVIEIEKVRAWQKLNSDKVNANQARRRAAKLQAMPRWLTAEDKTKIVEFYKLAKKLEQETGVKYHVDHIVPLQGINICGLHVPWNLQVIPAYDNISKSNKYNDW
jgi:hypothetical protein